MKAMMSVLFAMIMAFALVSSSEAGWFSSNDNPGAISSAHNTPGNVSTKDADRAGDITEGTLFPCGSDPAYTDYIDARAIPCTDGTRPPQVPEVMGTWN
ncbi:MAG: hypothetical protein WAN11_25830 [Syntrophobacteraceae bacterium]